MDSATERKLDRLLDYLESNKTMLARSSSSDTKVPTEAGSFGAIFGKIGDGLLRTVDNAGQLIGKAYDNTATVSDASKSISKVLGEFGTVGNLAGSALTGLTDIVMDAVDNWQSFSNFGLQFGGDSLALNDAVKKTGLSFREYEGILDKLTPSFVNFGMGITRGAEIFGELSNTLLNSPALQKQMNVLGLRTKDVNEALATVVRGAGMIDINNKQVMDGLLDSAVKLAREMDMMAKLTGISRKQQEQNIETMQNDERVRARIVMLRKENPQAEATIGEVQKQASALPPAIANLLSESIAGKGIMSSDKLAEFQQAFSPEAAAKLAEIGRMTTSQDAEERKKAIAETQNLIFMLAKERENGARFVAQGAVSNEFTKAAFEGANNPFEMLSKNLARYEQTMSPEAAVARVKEEAKLLGSGKLIEDLKDKDGKVIAKAGEDDPRRKTTEIVTDVNTEIKRFSSGLNEMITELNKTITLQRDANNKFVVSEAANKTAGYNQAFGSSTKDKINSIKVEIQSIGKMPTDWEQSIATILENKLKNILDSGTPKQAAGSKDVFGDWFNKDWGAGGLSMLHGKEAVVPEGKMEEFMKDMVAQNPAMSRVPNLSGILKNIPSKLSSAQDVPTVEETKIPGEINTQDKMVDKLDEISTTLAANLTELRSIASHARDTASNTKDMGGYIG